jgi:hypothetical protein
MKHLFVSGLALAACGGGGGDDSDFVLASAGMVGIYSLDSYTLNETACSPGGESISGEHSFAVAFQEKVFGFDLLTIMSCESPADCRAKVDDRTGFLIDYSFTVQFVGADGELTGGGSSSGFNLDGTCQEGSVFDTVLTLTGGQLRIEQGLTIADDYPADGDFCDTRSAQQAADGNSCSQMEVLTATFVEEL